MAKERLLIEVSEKGALVVKRNIDDIGKGAKKTGGAVRLLQGALGLLAAGALIRSMIQLSDTFTNIQNRLRTVTDSTEELVAVTNELFLISERTRSSFEATAEVYARVALASKDLGISQKRTLEFTESLNQAVILSGASATEAQAGLLQLSQGLASGTLRGDELRSVLEQLPVVADVIAKHMGITRGELRLMGQEGKISAEIVLDAFASAREELAERFGETVPTIGQAFTLLRNNVIRLVGEFTTGSGASSAFAEAIMMIASNIHRVMGVLNFFGDTLKALFIEWQALFQPLTSELQKVGVNWRSIFNNIGLVMLALLRTAAQVVDGILGLFLGVGNAIAVTMNDLPNVVGAIFIEGFNLWTGIVESGINVIIAGMNKVNEFFHLDPLESVDLGRLNNTFEEAGQDVAEAFMIGFEQSALTDLLDNVVSRVQDASAARQAAIQAAAGEDPDLGGDGAGTIPSTKEFDQYLANLEQEAVLLGMTNSEREIAVGLLKAQKATKAELSEVQLGAIEDQLRINQALADQAQILTEIKGPQEAYNRQVAALNALLDLNKTSAGEAGITLLEYTEKMAELNAEVEKQVSGDFDAVGQIWETTWQGAGQALDEFVQTGKISFRDLTSSILQDIQSIITKQIFLMSLKAVGLPGFQHGGSFMVGGAGGPDSQTVAFKATPGERVDVRTPGQQGAGGQTMVQSAPPVIKIVNVLDPAMIPDAMADEVGTQVIINTIAKNKGPVRQAMA